MISKAAAIRNGYTVATPTPTRLCPRDGELFAVRWLKGSRHDVAHRYFRRYVDAETYAEKLRGYGKRVGIFQSTTTWRNAE